MALNSYLQRSCRLDSLTAGSVGEDYTVPYTNPNSEYSASPSPKTYAAAQFLRLAHRNPDPSRHSHIQEYRAGVSLDAISPQITLKLNQLEKLRLTDELYFGSMYDTKPFRRDEPFRRYFQANIDVLYSFRSMVFFPDGRLVSCKVPRKETELWYTVPTYDKATVLETFYRTQVGYTPDLMSLENNSRPAVWVEGKPMFGKPAIPARPAAVHCATAHRKGEGVIDGNVVGEDMSLGSDFE